jgi:hypothetical protein
MQPDVKRKRKRVDYLEISQAEAIGIIRTRPFNAKMKSAASFSAEVAILTATVNTSKS